MYQMYTINSNEIIELNNVNSLNSSNISTIDEYNMIKNVLNDYYTNLGLCNFENSSIGPMPNILSILGLESEENIDLICQEESEYNPSKYIQSKTKYIDFKNKMLQYVSEEFFEKNFSQYHNMNGYVGFCNCAGGSTPCEVEDIFYLSSDKDIYNYIVAFKDAEMFEHYLEEINWDEKFVTLEECFHTYNMSFKFVDGRFVINSLGT